MFFFFIFSRTSLICSEQGPGVTLDTRKSNFWMTNEKFFQEQQEQNRKFGKRRFRRGLWREGRRSSGRKEREPGGRRGRGRSSMAGAAKRASRWKWRAAAVAAESADPWAKVCPPFSSGGSSSSVLWGPTPRPTRCSSRHLCSGYFPPWCSPSCSLGSNPRVLE